MTVRFVLLLCTLIVAPLVDSAYAASDPAVSQVQTLTSSLLKSMRAGQAASITDRHDA